MLWWNLTPRDWARWTAPEITDKRILISDICASFSLELDDVAIALGFSKKDDNLTVNQLLDILEKLVVRGGEFSIPTQSTETLAAQKAEPGKVLVKTPKTRDPETRQRCQRR